MFRETKKFGNPWSGLNRNGQKSILCRPKLGLVIGPIGQTKTEKSSGLPIKTNKINLLVAGILHHVRYKYIYIYFLGTTQATKME
jgi:hypothetical protein